MQYSKAVLTITLCVAVLLLAACSGRGNHYPRYSSYAGNYDSPYWHSRYDYRRDYWGYERHRDHSYHKKDFKRDKPYRGDRDEPYKDRERPGDGKKYRPDRAPDRGSTGYRKEKPYRDKGEYNKARSERRDRGSFSGRSRGTSSSSRRGK